MYSPSYFMTLVIIFLFNITLLVTGRYLIISIFSHFCIHNALFKQRLETIKGNPDLCFSIMCCEVDLVQLSSNILNSYSDSELTYPIGFFRLPINWSRCLVWFIGDLNSWIITGVNFLNTCLFLILHFLVQNSTRHHPEI